MSTSIAQEAGGLCQVHATWPAVCSLDGCGNPAYRRGLLCGAHQASGFEDGDTESGNEAKALAALVHDDYAITVEDDDTMGDSSIGSISPEHFYPMQQPCNPKWPSVAAFLPPPLQPTFVPMEPAPAARTLIPGAAIPIYHTDTLAMAPFAREGEERGLGLQAW
jgi:hypothetical protein